MPLIRRLPKRGFNNAAFKTIYAVVNLDDLEAFDDGATVDEAALLEKKLPDPGEGPGEEPGEEVPPVPSAVNSTLTASGHKAVTGESVSLTVQLHGQGLLGHDHGLTQLQH